MGKSIFECENQKLANLWEPAEELVNGSAVSEFVSSYKALEKEMINVVDTNDGWDDENIEKILKGSNYKEFIDASNYLLYKLHYLIGAMVSEKEIESDVKSDLKKSL